MSVNNFYLKDVTLVNNFKQIGADELEQLRVESGDVKLLPSSKNYDWYSTKKKVGSNLCEGEVITLGRARYANVKYWKGSFVSSNNIIVSSKDESKLLTKFLYYFLVEKLLCFYTTTSTYPKFDKNIFNRTKITIPPLEKQKEIVDKLDKFATLEAELKAELEARGKQYNHYRDQLLNCTTSNIFKNVIESERTVLITDLFNYERGKRLIKANRIKGDIPFVTAGHLNDGITEYISNEEKIFENCITIDMFGNIFWRPYKFMCDDNIICLGSDFLNESNALYFVEKIKMTINKFDYSKQYRIKHLENHRISVSFIRNELDHKAINKVSLLLNMIWKYTNNLYAGLPNEIELRAKQYEYYRNLLLAPANLRERERERAPIRNHI